jgi:hypothetical protein
LKRTHALGKTLVALSICFLVANLGCSSKAGHTQNLRRQSRQVSFPATIVGKVIRAKPNDFGIVAISPTEGGTISKNGTPLTLILAKEAMVRTSELGSDGRLVPRIVPVTFIKSGDIVTVEATVDFDNGGLIAAREITISPSANTMAKAAGVDYGNQGVIAGEVVSVDSTGFSITDVNGKIVRVQAGKSTPTLAGKVGPSAGIVDYSAVVTGVHATILGARREDGSFFANQIAITK